MKTLIKTLAVVTLSLAVSGILAGPAHADETTRVVSGIIQFHAGDMAGHTTQVCIDNGEIFVVENEGRGMDLLELEGQPVTATGTTRQNLESGETRITIADFYVRER